MNNSEPIISLENIDLSSCTILDKNFSGATFNGASFRGTRFDNVDFSGATFINCDFTECRMIGCQLDHAHAHTTDFSLVIFENCSVANMQMRECQMEAVSPYSTDLSQIDMDDATQSTRTDLDQNVGEILVSSHKSIIEHDLSKLRVLTQNDVEIMYAKHILFNYGMGGEKADFSNCRLTDLDLRHMQLNGADFTGALLEGVRMNDAGLCFCTFRDAKLVDCNLNCTIAEESDFCGATFTECKMRNGIFTHSNFAHTNFLDTDLWMSNFAFCCIDMSNLIGHDTEGINLADINRNEENWANDSGIRIGGMGGMQ